QKRWQRWMFRRETHISDAGAKRLLEANTKSILIASRDQPHTRGGADGRIRVRLQQPYTAGGEPIDVRRAHIGTAVTRDIRIPHVVGENEDNVGPALRLSRERPGGSERQRPERRATKHLPARDSALCH